MPTIRPAEPGDPAVWTMTVTVEGTPPDRHLEPAEHLERLLDQADGLLRAAGVGHVVDSSVHGPAAARRG